jgi:hypothetical protein
MSMANSAIGFVNIANRSVANGRTELNGKVLTRPALVVTDGDGLTYAVDVDIGSSAPGGLVSDGAYNALMNTPGLVTPSASNKGHYYRVSVAGTAYGYTYAVGDWVVSDGINWFRVENLFDSTLRKVTLARANVDLIYAEVGNPCRLRRTTNGRWEVVGFSKEMPGTYTRFAVDLSDLSFGPVEDLSVDARPLTYAELATFGGYGTVPYGAVGVFRGGVLQEIS